MALPPAFSPEDFPRFQDPAERKLKLTTELNNGRLAMTAMAGMLIQPGATDLGDLGHILGTWRLHDPFENGPSRHVLRGMETPGSLLPIMEVPGVSF